MPLVIPQSVNYQSPLVALPTKWNRTPPEGPQIIECEVDWSSMGGSAKCVSINLSINAPQTISQICALTVDNSGCGADITFIFPDTGTTLDIPAYESGTYPVFTNALSFFLSAPQSQNVDKTTFTIHNTMPPPVDIPKSVFQTTAFAQNVDVTITHNVTLIAPAVTGSLEYLYVGQVVTATAAWNFQATLKDGTGAVVAYTQSGGGAGNFTGQILLLPSVSLRFVTGLNVDITASAPAAGSVIYINAGYRTP